MKKVDKSNRIDALDLMKFIAVLLITNNHMKGIYPEPFNGLPAGGAFGDALFFFCSGFGLMISRGGNFFNWYKRRINRIYPTIFAVSIFSLFIGYKVDLLDMLVRKGGWFIQAILVFYAVFWFVKRYLKERLWIAFALDCFIIIGWFIIYWDKSIFILYDATYLRWPIFFLCMLQGAYFGKNYNKEITPNTTLCRDIVILLLLMMFYYGWQVAGWQIDIFNQTQIILVPALLGIVYCLYRICSSKAVTAFYAIKIINRPLYWISAMCLEIYLCGGFVLNLGVELIYLFPLNVILVLLALFALAYLTKVLSNIISQTFKSEDYNINKMYKL